MRKFIVVASFLSALILVPAAARAGFSLEGSVGKGYQATSPRAFTQSNLMLAPGYAPSLPVLSMFTLQLGIAIDFADKSDAKTDLQLRPMLLFVPPILPIYGRLILAANNLLERGNQSFLAYGGAVGVRIGIPSIAFVPAFGIFAEVGALPRSHDYGTESGGTTSKLFWVVESRLGAYLGF
jgi:hypothetical protein